MTNIEHTDSGITITGHAGYAPHGKDIVCAAISALVQTFIASVEELTEDEIIYIMEPGKIVLKHGNLSKRAQTLKDSFFVGVKMVADTYPDHVVIT